ncbi:MAG: phenylalanine--tRNA ligase subunit beta [Spirochaetaceae bacterium]|jgi:phenylalanyl-tRNA synthetase beta chain|nr:phenylalanine--tRNA ligase subunit beta [Spirochaetaceae bacterium]
MPKIEVNEARFFHLLGERCSYTELAGRLSCGKAELDEAPDESVLPDERVIKIELNDTNRPDLWSTAGIARQLRLHRTGRQTDFSPYFSTPADPARSLAGTPLDCVGRVVTVDPELRGIRPFMTAFAVSGKPVDEPMLLDIIQTQEKLCWNYGRKRRTISMGIYRSAHIKWPVHYRAVDPDKTSFVPLQTAGPMTCRQILSGHPKGREYGWIIAGFPQFPLLTDDTGEALSMAPIINSATLGAVQVGDSNLLVEMTGTDMPSLLLAANIVACDFLDNGCTILPCRVEHPYDTGFGKNITAPCYFQQSVDMSLRGMNKLLGGSLTADDAADALARMGNTIAAAKTAGGDTIFTVKPAPYRNDFLHSVDVMEDVMIGKTLAAFPPEKPRDLTVGRLTPLTVFSRKVKMQMAGLGYQEMRFNYLGRTKDYIDSMNIDGAKVIEIANPMSENYQFVRPSIIASLLGAEAGSGNAVYPHKIFEIGKVAFLDAGQASGTRTVHSLGFLTAANDANFNALASEAAALLYFLGHDYEVRESEDPRFIPGRQAEITVRGKAAGVFGEVHPALLEARAITMPCAAGEIDLEALL